MKIITSSNSRQDIHVLSTLSTHNSIKKITRMNHLAHNSQLFPNHLLLWVEKTGLHPRVLKLIFQLSPELFDQSTKSNQTLFGIRDYLHQASRCMSSVLQDQLSEELFFSLVGLKTRGQENQHDWHQVFIDISDEKDQYFPHEHSCTEN